MIQNLDIRDSLQSDLASIEKLYPDAFPDEDLLPVVRELLEEESNVLSLVAIVDRALVGHVIFTTCGVAERTEMVSMLAPLAVAPAVQKRGVGSALVYEGLRQVKEAGAIAVYVLGDPTYYGRFGFEAEADVTPPYDLPEEWRGAWQSISLTTTAQALRGMLDVPQPWRQPALWLP